MERLNVTIDSMHLSTVAAALLAMAQKYPMHITISGTLQECIDREQEIMKLLHPIRPTFTFGVGCDLLSITPSDAIAFKLHDFGRRGGE
jgi:hypothetical protein